MTKRYAKERAVPQSLFNVVLVALLLVSGLAIYGLFFRHTGPGAVNIAKSSYTSHDTVFVGTAQNTTVKSENNSKAMSPATAIGESRSLAINNTAKKKTSRITEAPAFAVAENIAKNEATPPVKEEEETGKANSFDYFTRYKVRGKAYIHTEPDESTRRAAFITHWNNAIIKPLGEQNGFIYIIFTNYEGVTSRGWLSKADLIRIR